MPQTTLALRFPSSFGTAELSAVLIDSGADAADTFAAHQHLPGTHLLLVGERDFYVVLEDRLSPEQVEGLKALCGKSLIIAFPERTPVRRRLKSCASVKSDQAAGAEPDDVSSDDARRSRPQRTCGRGARPARWSPRRGPLFLLPDGTLAEQASGPAPTGGAAAAVLITAARWISTRRTSTFERLFPPSAFHPEQALRSERLTAEQAQALLQQVAGALADGAVTGPLSGRDALAAAQLRSAGLTVLSHIVATLRRDPGYAQVAAAATEGDLCPHRTGSGSSRRPGCPARARDPASADARPGADPSGSRSGHGAAQRPDSAGATVCAARRSLALRDVLGLGFSRG